MLPVEPIKNRLNLNVKAVVLATDLGDWSHNAGEFAALFARNFAAKLVISHVFLPSQAAMEVEAEGTPVSGQRKELASLLAQRASVLSASARVETVPVLLDGTPEEAIPRLAAEYAPSLIAMGTHGGSRLERMVMGSVAEKILRSTPWPCLTVGPRVAEISSANDLPFRRILYATDLTPAAAHAAAYAVFLAETLGAKIDVLRVVHGGEHDREERTDDLRQRFREALEGLVPRHAEEFCQASAFVESGSAHHRILEHIQERGIDLLVLGIRKTPHLGLQMRTSGAFQLLAAATCPVLTVTG